MHEVITMCEFDFAKRLSLLRIQKNVSAREMSLGIGQNPSYINNIENNKMLPSMTVFYYICDYLNIKPKDFFDDGSYYPNELAEIISNLNKLDAKQIQHIGMVIGDLANKK